MKLSGILLYSGRAVLFAFAVSFIWALTMTLWGRKHPSGISRKRFFLLLLFVFYLAALVQITVIRNWGADSFFAVQPIPLKTTLEEFFKGPWPFCYHVIGNMVWFIPLGIMGPALFSKLKKGGNLLFLALFLSAGIETLQWCFSTGVSDVDDILLNGLGALCGFGTWGFLKNGKNLAGSFVIAFSMYSRIPMPQVEWTEQRMKYAMCFFPLVGVVIGVMEWGIIFLCRDFDLAFAGKLLPVVLPILVTGGIHMDGLLDVIDAKSSHAPRERKLEILKDPHTGAFAIIGCLTYFLLYLAAFGEIKTSLIPAYFFVFPITRAFSGLSVVTFPLAKKSGLAAAFSDGAQKQTVRNVMAVFLAAAFLFLWIFFGLALALTLILTASLVCWYYYAMAKREFGGITGDLAGYFLQVCELALTAAIAVISHF